jgi:hypothetical protein
MRTIVFLSLSSVVLLSGCASAPMSLLDGTPYHRTHLNRYPVRIVAVNGDFTLEQPKRVYAGVNSLVLEAEPVGGVKTARQQAVAFKVSPCTRYYLAAERETSLSQNWKLVIDHVEPIAMCNRDEEVAKSRKEGIPLADIIETDKSSPAK